MQQNSTGSSSTGSLRRSDPAGSERRYFRSADRYFSIDGSWYFSSREGDRGPFPTKVAAMRAVETYLTDCNALVHFEEAGEHPESPPLQVARPFSCA